jgi:hypothetical protein
MEHNVKKAFLGFAAALAASASSGATVNITSTGNYGTIVNHTSCTTAPAVPCANFLATHNVTGTFTTSGPLPANASNLEIGSTVTSYSFSSGLDVIASSDPNARLNTLRISTDAAGKITSMGPMLVTLWLTGTAPHTAADRVSGIVITGTSASAVYNSGCDTVATGGVADICTIYMDDSSRSQASGASVRVAAPAGPVSIPTLSQAGTMLMTSLLGLFAFRRLRRRR